MEKYQELRDQAKRKIQIADHMLTMTYPMVQDTRLLLAVLENVFLALTNAMGSLLYYEQLYKRVPPFSDNFESKFRLFRDSCSSKYSIDEKYFQLMRNIKDLIMEHKKSPVEFVRKDRFVICSHDYKMKAISLNDIRDFLDNAKKFVQQTNSILIKNEVVFAHSIKVK